MPMESGVNDGERRLFDSSSAPDARSWLTEIETDGERHRDTSTTVEVV